MGPGIQNAGWQAQRSVRPERLACSARLGEPRSCLWVAVGLGRSIIRPSFSRTDGAPGRESPEPESLLEGGPSPHYRSSADTRRWNGGEGAGLADGGAPVGEGRKGASESRHGRVIICRCCPGECQLGSPSLPHLELWCSEQVQEIVPFLQTKKEAQPRSELAPPPHPPALSRSSKLPQSFPHCFGLKTNKKGSRPP